MQLGTSIEQPTQFLNQKPRVQLNLQGWILINSTCLMKDVSESRLDDRQRGLLFRFNRMVARLNALVTSMENPCVDNTILKDGECVECPEDIDCR